MNDITVILNLYKRGEYLQEQIDAINNQTIKPKEIWFYQNELHFAIGGDPADPNRPSIPKPKSAIPVARFIHSFTNQKYHARFAFGLLASTEWVAFFDDDTIPGPRWFENCIKSYEELPGIYGGAGVTLACNTYNPHYRSGWPSQNKKTVQVDLVGHAWFMKRKDLSYLWYEVPMSFDNGEDIQLSYLAQKYGNVKTYCPPHPVEDLSLWSSLKGNEYGMDKAASSTNVNLPLEQFMSERDECIKTALRGGWRTNLGVQNYDRNSVRN